MLLEGILNEKFIAIDTETTSLNSFKDGKLFSVIIANESEEVYLNFNTRDEQFLNRDLLKSLVFKDKTIFFANAKFDMHFLNKEGVTFENCQFWDILVVAKCLYNTHMRYDLDSVAKRAGFEKLKTVEEYIKQHKLYEKDESGTRVPLYERVPFPIISEYAMRDARITFDIGMKQVEEVRQLEQYSISQKFPSFEKLIEQEMKVTEVCYEMEKRGLQVDKEFLQRALRHEQDRALQASEAFTKIANVPFVDSNKNLATVFSAFDVSGGTTRKGNASFTDEVLQAITHPLAAEVRNYRDASKRANTYYKNFLSFADQDGIIHPSIRQAGADTFRFSITAPALQTLNSEESGEYKVRDSFRARDGYSLVAIDYAQQEYRLTADYAGEMALIKQIKEGADVHTATALLMGVTRTQAKTLNFMLLYGGGVAKLCLALFKPRLQEVALKAVTWKYVYRSTPKDPKQAMENVHALESVTQEDISHDLPLLQQSHDLQQKYFSSLPKTKFFIDRVTDIAKNRGFIYNWAGRRLYFPDKRFCYKAPNHLIQSSGAEIMRGAMVGIHDFLKPKKSKIILSIHDELLLEMPKEEFDLIPKIREIMVNVYKPYNGLMMDTSVEIGKSWGSMEEYKDGSEKGNSISGESA